MAVSSLLGWVGTDKDGRAVTPCYSYMHQEKEAYGEFVERYGKDRFYSISGRAADAEWAAFKLFAMKEKEPEMYSRTDKLLSFKDYINLKLTGVAAMDHTTAAYTYLYDIKEGRWSSEMLGTFGITESFFPKLRKPFEKIGCMKEELCEELAGSVMHIPVIAGSTDGSTAVLGAGGLECGMSVNVMGTTGVFFSVSDSVENISSCGLIANPHVIPGKWLVGGPMGMFGGTIGWLTESIGGRQFSLGDLTERAKEIRPGSDGVIVYPCLAGERAPFWNPEMTGTILGLKNKHGLVHVFRGIMEAEGYGVKNMIEKFFTKPKTFRKTFDIEVYQSVKQPLAKQYFEDFIPEVFRYEYPFADCGGYSGDTALGFCSFTYNKYKKIYFIEADPATFEKGKDETAALRDIEYFKAAVTDCEKQLNFSADFNTGSKVTEEGLLLVEGKALDSIVKEDRAFIKMDIEGAEKEAILGAKRLIKNGSLLALSAYHKAEDIRELPETIIDINPDYNFYLRHYTDTVFETVLYAVPQNC